MVSRKFCAQIHVGDGNFLQKNNHSVTNIVATLCLIDCIQFDPILRLVRLLSFEKMPKSGRRWFQLREDYRVEAELGNDQLFESLISRMIAKDELERPSANQIASWGPFKTEVSRRKESLIQMLEAERSKNEELEKEIEKLNQSALSHMSNS